MKTLHTRADFGKLLLVIAPLIAGLIWTAGPMRSQQGAAPSSLHLYKVQGNVWAVIGAATNITVQAGDDGLLVVNTGLEATAPDALRAIRAISNQPISWVVNTSMDLADIGANEALPKLSAGGVARVRVIAHENVLNRLSSAPAGSQARLPEVLWPNDEYYQPRKDFAFNGEAILVDHVPAAHTDGDSIVHFRRSDVLSTGGVFTPDRYPVIDIQHGGSIQGIVAAMNRILEITVPLKYQEAGTYIVPGYGRICDEGDAAEYRDMVTIVRDDIKDYIAKGMTLDQVKAAHPTLEYDTEYTRHGGPTGDEFTEAVYLSLSKKN